LLARSRSLAGGSADGSWVNSRCPLPSDLCPLGRCPLGAFLGGPCPLPSALASGPVPSVWAPSALCPLPSAFCPLPSALCPLPSAL